MVLMVSCLTYDKAIIYHKGYTPGENNNLKFHGFYSDTLVRPTYDADKFATIMPLFFYGDGSVVYCSIFKDTNSLKRQLEKKIQSDQWGNYRIIDDTLEVESFWYYAVRGKKERLIWRGLIRNGSIYFYEEVDSDGNARQFAEQIRFVPFVPLSIKPDSTKNWIRKSKRYNQ